MTCLDLITAALFRIGVLQAGETPSGEDAADAFLRLNDLVDSFATEALTIYTITRTTWTIVSGTASYTVGTSGTVNIARPVFVEAIKFIDTTPDPDFEMDLDQLTDQAYQALPQKALTSTYPTGAYYNPTFTSSAYATVTFYPVPTSTTLQGVIYAHTAVPQFASQSTTIALPPGYKRMLRDNLAVELAPEWGVQPDHVLIASAKQSKQLVKRANVRLSDLTSDAAYVFNGRGYGYSILSDR